MVLTPQQADRSDFANGITMILGVVVSFFAPVIGIAMILMGGFNAVCVSIERHLPMDSPHRHTLVN